MKMKGMEKKKMSNKLSVVTYVSEASAQEFYLAELVSSVYDLADEIVIVDGDSGYNNRDTMTLIAALKEKFQDDRGHNKIWAYYNPWEWRLGKNMGRIQRSIAISHATGDWVILLDADEVLHEKDFDKITDAMKYGDENNDNVFSFRTIHFYRDYWHYKAGENPSDPGNEWYNHRPKMFRNGLGIFDMHDHKGHYSGLVSREAIDLQIHAQTTSIEVFHLGHVRSKKSYVEKTNLIERSYHPEWKDIDVDTFEWDMRGTYDFEGTHPVAMKRRIENFEKIFGKDGDK